MGRSQISTAALALFVVALCVLGMRPSPATAGWKIVGATASDRPSRPRDPGAVHHDVQPTESSLRQVDGGGHLLRRGDVSWAERRPVAEPSGRGGSIRAGQIQHHHVRAGLVERPNGGQTQTGRPARDQRGLSLDAHARSIGAAPGALAHGVAIGHLA